MKFFLKNIEINFCSIIILPLHLHILFYRAIYKKIYYLNKKEINNICIFLIIAIESNEIFKNQAYMYLRINENHPRTGVCSQQLASHAHSFHRVECLRHLNCLPVITCDAYRGWPSCNVNEKYDSSLDAYVQNIFLIGAKIRR